MRSLVLLWLTSSLAFGAPSNGEKRWEVPIALSGGIALATNGAVYVAAADGRVYAFETSDGNLRWQSLNTYAGLFGPPVVGPEGNLYASAGTRLHALDSQSGAELWTRDFTNYGPSIALGPDGSLYAVSEFAFALDPDTGAVRWEWRGDFLEGVPVLAANEMLYVISGGGTVLGMETRRGQRVWRFVDDDAHFISLALAGDGTVLALGAEGELFALDGATGEKRWAVPFDRQVSGIIVAPDGTIPVGTGRAIHVLDGATGETLRQLPLDFDLWSPLTLTDDGTLYVADYDRLYALDFATGRTNWLFEPAGSGLLSPAVDRDGTVFFATWSIEHVLCALRGSSRLADAPWPTSFQNSQNTSFWTVRGMPKITRQPQSHWAAADSRTAFHVYSPVMGPLQIQWHFNGQPIAGATNYSFELDRVHFADAGTYSVTLSNAFGGLASDEAILLVGYAINLHIVGPGTVERNIDLPVYPANAEVRLTALPRESRRFLRWSGDVTSNDLHLNLTLDRNYELVAEFEYLVGDVKWKAKYAPETPSQALGANGFLYYGTGTARGSCIAVDTRTGRKVWETGLSGNVESHSSIGPDGTVYIGDYGGWLWALDGQTGAQKHRFRVGSCVHTCATIGPDGTVYVPLSGQGLEASHPTTYSRKWLFEAPVHEYPPALSADGVLYVPGDRLYALDALTGKKLWEFEPSGMPAPTTDGKVYVRSGRKKLYALNALNGAITWEFELDTETDGAGDGPPIVGPDGTVYLGAADGKVYAVDGATGTKRWDFSTMTYNSTPAITADGTLYVPAGPTLYALNANGGQELWRFNTGWHEPQGCVNVGPDGTIYYGGYALHGTSPLASRGWPKFQYSGDSRGRAPARPRFDPTRLRFTSEGFAGTIVSEPGATLTIEWVAGSPQWSELETVTNTVGTVDFLDRTPGAGRAYRAVER